MPLVSMNAFLPQAKKEGFAVGQFNVNNLEFVQAIIEAGKEERSPLIFGASEGAIRYMGLNNVVALAKAAAEEADVPVALHLDHGSSFEVVMKCIRAGFSSVMFDGSHYPFEENIRLTKKVVEAAHAVGVSVEGELGTIGGVEDDLNVSEEDAALADPEQAIRFWEETKVDAMAIAVGTAHGMYKGEPKIRYDIIEKVASQIEAPIVLHGGSGVPDESIQKAVSLGVGKINVNTENQVAMVKVVRELLDKNPDMIDPRKYLGPAREAIKETVKAKMRLFGSSGKA
ncbi:MULTISPECIES: class II fructose-1,6-bisphosphate aldolase [Thermoactinomyces]|jgi:fructose-bisphosphate aldolase, class II|uniref:Class II fructose-1,6-bisphosphate aldolase n=1 Tax=Thermoactinomyces vulgaris TaxID=2026 RepID=A0ABS0QH56_THEVU|nr:MULTISPECIES: class II fructose-1,6-bisphosphate aldolase [Thermoactinomyces]KFZ40317.1 tagatose-bisphosphate aldolase [Thermoactinomyces sp. Gus2-1]KYQ86166.1 tagatose-bisphosphate aldolase [Thermoactinomyces sp. AS95]MBA4551082.1 class II fructose-1,6-bisphosphate aldolase [Thermoactinomyces vulgaris]MBA4596959.1 class II fructose-1,6-bisphosphate aldolase [Thermoactinomyces vulgaris]MBH8583626.1 class II fructose-1,6-bisphosphate aldolase [Thermoactinomyces sp. CICC 10735]